MALCRCCSILYSKTNCTMLYFALQGGGGEEGNKVLVKRHKLRKQQNKTSCTGSRCKEYILHISLLKYSYNKQHKCFHKSCFSNCCTLSVLKRSLTQRNCDLLSPRIPSQDATSKTKRNPFCFHLSPYRGVTWHGCFLTM